MVLFSVSDTKRFMNLLFKGSLFDTYEIRGVNLQLFTMFEISGRIDNEYAQTQEGDGEPKYCLWSEIKPIVLNLIKGKKTPRVMKIIFCLSGYEAALINENAAALFITVKYENGVANVLTGTAQKRFSLEKNVDIDWDNYVKNMFAENTLELTIK